MIFFNELEAILERVTTKGKSNLFLLVSNSVRFENAGNIFGVRAQSVRQMLNVLLNKLK
ncbi:hypothetical protein SXYLSMQ121_1909 [Staphylococcus xylosus]|nr:hypothetical protein SXYLSMQ121_1909 [Staphylococcus xylosus]